MQLYVKLPSDETYKPGDIFIFKSEKCHKIDNDNFMFKPDLQMSIRPINHDNAVIELRQQLVKKLKKLREIKKFAGGYGRTGIVAVIKSKCALCYEDKLCVYIDGSEGEYEGESVCPECVRKECDKGV